MKRLVILGGGTAGTMVANKLRPRLPHDEWSITVVDQDRQHHYQPGYLFVPFGTYEPDEIVRPRERYLSEGVELLVEEIDRVLPDESLVRLADETELSYDQLVIATGTHPRPEETPGMADELWRDRVFDFYTLEGATALRDKLRTWDGGRLVVQICELPIKCPVAPLEFAFLADDHFRERGMRDRVEIVYVTPLDGAFTKPIASAQLGGMLEERKILLETDFMIEQVDNERSAIVSYDEREVPFDLLVTVPVNMGADYVARSGLGNELNHVPVDPGTLQSTQYDDIFAVGDAADLPTSKAGSVAHFSIEVFTENFLEHIAGRPMTHAFDGHANCFVESGDGKGLLIDFNYDTEPLPGRYPVPGVGPFKLLEESKLNHWGKMAFKWTYWNVLLPGRRIPLPAEMSMAGKKPPTDDHSNGRQETMT
ncbi:MAG: FAD/NAD(P)-binding oxidoreductase [Nitriliruptorales bacterium]|nr:FAD/NAD(P)-binding oxidoreductase [Nitriliruptorales bacterium]